MDSLYEFINKEQKSKLEGLSKLIEEGKHERAQSKLMNIIFERTLYMGVLKEKGIENKIDHTMKVYVAGPYTPKETSLHEAARVAHLNTEFAIHEGMQVIDKGHFPYIPHLLHFIHLYGGKSLPYEYYADAGIEWLQACDAILYYDGRIGKSKGADNELKIAIDSGKTVFFSIYEIPHYVPAKKQNL